MIEKIEKENLNVNSNRPFSKNTKPRYQKVKKSFRKSVFLETKNPKQSAFELCLHTCKVIMMSMNKFMTGRKGHECYQTYFKTQIIGQL